MDQASLGSEHGTKRSCTHMAVYHRLSQHACQHPPLLGPGRVSYFARLHRLLAAEEGVSAAEGDQPLYTKHLGRATSLMMQWASEGISGLPGMRVCADCGSCLLQQQRQQDWIGQLACAAHMLGCHASHVLGAHMLGC